MNKKAPKNNIDFKFADPAMNQFAAFVVGKFVSLDGKMDEGFKKVNQKFNHVGALIEHLDGKTDTIIEAVGMNSEKVEKLSEKIVEAISDIKKLKDITPAHTEMIHEINGKIDKKADAADLKKLENRVTILETA